MSGVRDLGTILATLEPELLEGEFVFCSLAHANLADVLHLDPVATFSEREGVAVVIRVQAAIGHNLPFDLTLRCIVLNVHSDLAAVGLTAAFATALTAAGISANVVAAYHHDHVFVPTADAQRAVEVLQSLQREAQTEVLAPVKNI
jgi:hypothetical protein